MKNTDKVTLTFGLLKRLVKESSEDDDLMALADDLAGTNLSQADLPPLEDYIANYKKNAKFWKEHYRQNPKLKQALDKDAAAGNQYAIELKKVVDESYDDNLDNFEQEGSVVINSLNKISNQLNKVLYSTKFSSQSFTNEIKTALDSIDNAKRSYMV